MAKPWEKYEPQEPEEEEQEGPWAKYSQPMAEGVQQDVGMFGVTAESAVRGTVDNLMNAPNVIGDFVGNALAYPAAAIKGTVARGAESLARFNLETGEPLTPYSDFLDEARATWPASTLIQGYDAPTSTDIQAGLTSVARGMQPVGVPGQLYTPPQRPLQEENEFKNVRDSILEGYIQRREEFPVGANTGDVLSDVMTLYMGRAPVVNTLRNRRMLEGPQVKVPKSSKMDPGVRRWTQERVEGFKDWFAESGIKIAEAGAEGSILAALQDEDPISNAAFGAGAQTMANVADAAWREVPDLGMKPGIGRTTTKAAIVAAGMTALWQLVKSVTPGGRDRILESEEAAYNKVAGMMILGGLTSAAGFSRPTQRQLDDLNLIIDTWHSSRRGAVMSLFSEWQNDDSGDMDRILNQLSQDPTYFNQTALRRINRAMENEDVRMKDVIDTLMESDRDFRRKLTALREQQ